MNRNTSTTRSEEIAVVKKIFKLQYRGYVEKKFVSLVQGRFAITKLMVDEEVLDIRVVWNSKSNRYNKQIWVPSFMLPTWLDAENMVCKWLVSTVGSYLSMGSPMQDYTLEQGSFHQSEQADIDLGEIFHDFIIHKAKRHALGVRCVQTNNRWSDRGDRI